jgi:hypothetical protein
VSVAAPEAGAAAASAAGVAGVEGRDPSKGVLLAIAIVLLWLAGFCFFIAFEGSALLSESSSTTGGGLLKAMVFGLAGKALKQEQGGQ